LTKGKIRIEILKIRSPLK